jgi:hypothetical protein
VLAAPSSSASPFYSCPSSSCQGPRRPFRMRPGAVGWTMESRYRFGQRGMCQVCCLTAGGMPRNEHKASLWSRYTPVQGRCAVFKAGVYDNALV